MSADLACAFCQIVRGETSAARVFEDEHCLAFLDRRPVFFGHTLVVPREHHETLLDLPPGLLAPLFGSVQLVAAAVERGLDADGAWITVNHKVSQSVAHVHVHVVPRRLSDGLKGFFWPRQRYSSEAHMLEVARFLSDAIIHLRFREVGGRSTT